LSLFVETIALKNLLEGRKDAGGGLQAEDPVAGRDDHRWSTRTDGKPVRSLSSLLIDLVTQSSTCRRDRLWGGGTALLSELGEGPLSIRTVV
jgi:hypothetical protein